MNILLVEPEFPIHSKSKNHKDFLPVGLLKLHDYFQSKGHFTKIIRGNKDKREIGQYFKPDQIMVTSLFTYWSKYVWNTVKFYRNIYPNTKIIIGGVYASLMSNHQEFRKKLKLYNAEVFLGIHQEAEEYAANHALNYSVLVNPHPIDYQIIHTSRGCIHKCEFCGVWKIEPTFKAKRSIKNEITNKKIVFYDNNFLANPNVENILNELIDLKSSRQIIWCESQSGFDGIELQKNPHIGEMIKKAGFRFPRIAWDGHFKNYKLIKDQIGILIRSGYKLRNLFVFMLYNWDIPFKEMEKKRIKCFAWGVQIADCRYRPLDQISDNYNPFKKDQSSSDYYIHEKSGWTDILVKQFRKNVRRQNICLRHEFPYYSNDFEMKIFNKTITAKTKYLRTKKEKMKFLRKMNIDYWFPNRITYPANDHNK